MNKKWTFVSFVLKSEPFLGYAIAAVLFATRRTSVPYWIAIASVALVAILDLWLYKDAIIADHKEYKAGERAETLSRILISVQDIMFLCSYYLFMLLLGLVVVLWSDRPDAQRDAVATAEQWRCELVPDMSNGMSLVVTRQIPTKR